MKSFRYVKPRSIRGSYMLASINSPKEVARRPVATTSLTSGEELCIGRSRELSVWVARIKNWDNQSVMEYVSSSKASFTWQDSNTNVVDYYRLNRRFLDKCPILASRFKTRVFEIRSRLDSGQSVTSIPEKAPYEHYTANERAIELVPQVKSLAMRLVAKEGTPLAKARKFFEWITQHVEYGSYVAGDGGAHDTLRKKVGDCASQSFLFVALCRASGVPARVVAGWWALPDAESPHVWSECYINGLGWVPVDVSRANLLRRSVAYRSWAHSHGLPDDYDFYFGNMDNARITLSKGSNIGLRTQQHAVVSHQKGHENVALLLQPASQICLERGYPPSDFPTITQRFVFF